MIHSHVEYLEAMALVNTEVLANLILIIATKVPNLTKDMKELSSKWTEAAEKVTDGDF